MGGVGKRAGIRKVAGILALAALLLACSPSPGQPPSDDTRARIDQLEKEVRELKELLKQSLSRPVTEKPDLNKLIDEKLKKAADDSKKKEQEKKAREEEKAREAVVVGEDRKLNVTWD